MALNEKGSLLKCLNVVCRIYTHVWPPEVGQLTVAKVNYVSNLVPIPTASTKLSLSGRKASLFYSGICNTKRKFHRDRLTAGFNRQSPPGITLGLSPRLFNSIHTQEGQSCSDPAKAASFGIYPGGTGARRWVSLLHRAGSLLEVLF